MFDFDVDVEICGWRIEIKKRPLSVFSFAKFTLVHARSIS